MKLISALFFVLAVLGISGNIYLAQSLHAHKTKEWEAFVSSVSQLEKQTGHWLEDKKPEQHHLVDIYQAVTEAKTAASSVDSLTEARSYFEAYEPFLKEAAAHGEDTEQTKDVLRMLNTDAKEALRSLTSSQMKRKERVKKVNEIFATDDLALPDFSANPPAETIARFSYTDALPQEAKAGYEAFVREHDPAHLKGLTPEQTLLVFFELVRENDAEAIYALSDVQDEWPNVREFAHAYNRTVHHKLMMDTNLYRGYDELYALPIEGKVDEPIRQVRIKLSQGTYSMTNIYGVKKNEQGIWVMMLAHLIDREEAQKEPG